MSKFMDWLFGPEMLSKREVLDYVDYKERHQVQRFESQIQILKAKISDMEKLRHRVNQLEAAMPKRDAKGHFVKKLPEPLYNIFNELASTAKEFID